MAVELRLGMAVELSLEGGAVQDDKKKLVCAIDGEWEVDGSIRRWRAT